MPISSCVRIDGRVSAVATRLVHKHEVLVLLGPFIRNTESMKHYSPMVSSEILSPLWFRNKDQSFDCSKEHRAFFFVHLAPLTGQFSFPEGFFGSYGQNLYGVGTTFEGWFPLPPPPSVPPAGTNNRVACWRENLRSMTIAQDCGNKKGGVCSPAKPVEPSPDRGEMTMCESNDDLEYNFCASFRRPSIFFTRSPFRRSNTIPTGSLTWRL